MNGGEKVDTVFRSDVDHDADTGVIDGVID